MVAKLYPELYAWVTGAEHDDGGRGGEAFGSARGESPAPSVLSVLDSGCGSESPGALR